MKEKKTVLALGFFDGLHLGHAALLRRAKEVAETLGAEAAALTFDAHPDLFVRGEPVRLVCSAHDRAYILRRFFGIDRVCYIHFNAETMRTDWRVFLEQLAGTYGAAHFVVGYDFRFGHGGRGTAALLSEWCAECGLGCDVIPAVTLDGGVVSSTRIRALLAEGDISAANRLLGHPYLLTDTVRTGFRLGRTMDYPTVNMRFEDGVLAPRFGVYASRVMLPAEDGQAALDAVTNVGVRPTFDESGTRVTVETHIFDFDAELYGKRLCVEFHGFLRPERPFASPEALSAQIRADAARARALLRDKKRADTSC